MLNSSCNCYNAVCDWQVNSGEYINGSTNKRNNQDPYKSLALGYIKIKHSSYGKNDFDKIPLNSENFSLKVHNLRSL